MNIYKDLSGRSAIAGYDIKPGAIVIEFRSGAIYTYSYGSAGAETVDEMIRLALAGRGLATFVSRNKPHFSTKLVGLRN